MQIDKTFSNLLLWTIGSIYPLHMKSVSVVSLNMYTYMAYKTMQEQMRYRPMQTVYMLLKYEALIGVVHPLLYESIPMSTNTNRDELRLQFLKRGSAMYTGRHQCLIFEDY
jgi:hypothetical protein